VYAEEGVMSRRDSCLSHWFPIVQAAGLPVPKTVIVRAPDLSPWLTRKPDETLDSNREIGAFLDDLHIAAHEVGPYPIFLRTGHGSNKHEWVDTCWVPNAGALSEHAYALFEWSHLVDMLGLPTDVWVVRELLKTSPAFYAFEGMPITRERRLFVRDGKTVCAHPYWPADAIAHGRPPDRKNWRECLMKMNADRPGDAEEIVGLAERAAAVLPGFWSVDFLHTTDRGWVLIDMAAGERSFHWNDCPRGPRPCLHGRIFHESGCECAGTNLVDGYLKCERDCVGTVGFTS
jgi:hypothetical protein